MAGLPYTPGNYQHGAHINVTGQFNNLYSSGAFKLPEDPRTVANQVLAAFSTVRRLTFTASANVTSGPGDPPFVSILNANAALPAVDILVTVNNVPFVIPPTTSIFLMLSNGGAQQII